MARAAWIGGIAAVGITGVLMAQSASAQADTGPHLSASVTTFKNPSPTGPGGGARAAASAACSPGPNLYNRTEFCAVDPFKVTVLQNRTQVGSVTFTITQSIHLNVKSRNFTENISIGNVRVTGSGGGIRMGLAVSCGNPCKATNHFPQQRVLTNGTKGTISYFDGIAAGKIHSTTSSYALTFAKPGYNTGGLSYSSLAYRCDDALAGQGAGCVFPSFNPTITSLATLPDIAAGIRRIQSNSPGHYGRSGSGHPLHRNPSEAKRKANYNAVCQNQTPPPGNPPPSCGEYPFAGTYEGGKTLNSKNRGITWVPLDEQRSRDGLIKTFYYADRVLDKDAFWVQA